MSTRKSTNKAAIDSSVSISPDPNSVRSTTTTTTRSSLQTPGSESDVTDTNTLLDAKRSRRPNVRTPTTPSSNTKKKSDDSVENASTGTDADDKINKSPGDDTKSEDGKKTDSLTDSPARASRKRKVFDKTAIVTRKSALDLANSTKRVLRERRNSTGKCEENEPKKRGAKKSTSLTPEPPMSLKRKRENSTKSDDKEEMKRAEKMIKLEPLETEEVQKTENDEIEKIAMSEDLSEEDKLKLLVEETDSKDDELVEVVEIKQEIDEDTEDVPMEENVAKESEDEEKSRDQDKDQETEGEREIPVISEIADEDEIDSKKLSLSSKTEEQSNPKKAPETAQVVPPQDVDKKNTNKEGGKTEEDAKYEAYERPRRARAKKLIETPPTPAKRGRKSEKLSSEETSDNKPKPSRKTQPKTSSSETSKTEEVIKIVSVAELEVETECNQNVTQEEVVNGTEKPLVVDTNSEVIAIETVPGTSTGQTSEKAASLSPELVSEGVSVISVKQFYKKPEFLENNLGIEKDPKLGEIVQEVEKNKEETAETVKTDTASTETVLPCNSTDTVPPCNSTNINLEKIAVLAAIETSPDCSGDSLKEGERLVLDDSTEEDGSIGINKIDSNDESDLANSGEATIIAPDFSNSEDSEQAKLQIDEEEEEDETLSNSASTEKMDVLQTICDSTIVNTAVDTNEEEEIVQEGDNEIKDKTTCNKSSIDEMSDSEKQHENTEPVQLEQRTDKNEVDFIKEEETKNSDFEEVLKDEDRNVIIEDNYECEKETNELKVDLEENSMEVDEIIESKENVKDDEDVKDVLENTLPFDSPKKDENSDDDLSTEKNDKKLLETPETLKQKETHLKHLGLLTHKAAVEAKIEKQRTRKLLQNNRKNGGNNGANNNNNNGQNSLTSDSAKNNGSGSAGNCNENSQEYTGTLKTVIKLNRQANGSNANENKRKPIAGSSGTNGGGGRQSLKMTFQKGRARGINTSKDPNQATNSGDDTYYTIQNEIEGIQQQEAVTHGRKSHNRYHSTDVTNVANLPENVEKKDEKEIILIPEKASSFDIHPGRLCQDQCFYCGGKFGLYDTPCHVAQLKNAERQQKILANEEKLTVDNCLCEACFRHVDRRANAPQSFKKRLSAPSALESGGTDNSSAILAQSDTSTTDELSQSAHPANTSQTKSVCFVTDCNNFAAHPLRRKFIRKTIKKILPNFDMSTIGGSAPICAQHYDAIVQYLGCALCKRRLVKNNMYHINQLHESARLEKLLEEQGIPVRFGNNTAVCKLCRYFTNLLLKPPDIGKIQKKQFVKNYRKRLLHFYNIQAEDSSDGEEQGDDKSDNESEDKDEEAVKIETRGRKKKPVQTTDLTESEKDSRADTNTPQSSEDGQALTSGGTSGQMMLDNDVLVDYDMPVPISESPSPPPLQMPSKLQSILQSGNTDKDDISIVLRSNPNISMRELFPGEEEMGLQINVPFGGSTSVRTPEGWTRVNTFLQYDDPTRRLWEDLQKPYGNQSSFLRHLILLEKYFRNGDLVLSQNASTNAVVYSDTIHNRLRSYDNLNVPPKSRPSKSKTKSSNCETPAERISKQFSNLPVTITAKPRGQPTPSTSGSAVKKTNPSTANSSNLNSILKRNLLSNNRSIEILPISSSSESGSTGPNNKSGINIGLTRQQRLLEAATRLISNSQESHSNQPGNKKAAAGSSVGLPPELISINRNQIQLIKHRQTQVQPKPGTSKSIPPNVIVLPDTLSALERMQSKNWRPTLVPVSSVNPGAHLNASGPLYQTADGRRLPALVQVQSGGRPYLISIYDYNRMCILRREKLMREQIAKGGKKNSEDNGSKEENSSQQQSQQSNKVQIPNKILEQNSLIPVNATNKSLSMDQKNKKLPQQSLLKSSLSNSLVPIAPKPAIGSFPIVPSSIASQQHLLGQNNPASSVVPVLPTLSNALTIASPSTAGNSTSWLWSNINDSNNHSNGNLVNKNINLTASSSSASSSNSSSPSVVKQQQSQGNPAAIILDNTLLSKIPKSLTVIPQQKSKERSRGNSVDDLTSA